MKLGTETISLENYMMSEAAGCPEPKVGMGATILMWTDRHAATIVKVTPTQVHVQQDECKRIDQNGMSESQQYEYTPNPEAEIQIFRLTKNGYRLSGGGATLRIGSRNSYHDYSF